MHAMAGQSSGASGNSAASASAIVSGTRSAGGGVMPSPSPSAAAAALRTVSATVGGAPYSSAPMPPLHAATSIDAKADLASGLATAAAAAPLGSGAAAAEAAAALTPPRSAAERMYSAKQLTEALRSGLQAVKDQLQVLAILDGTALSWPGVSQSVDDLDFLTDMVAQTTNRLEAANRGLQVQLDGERAESASLKESLATASNRNDDLQRQCNVVHRDLREVRVQLEDTKRDAQQVRQELWTVEKQRADAASELERTKAELEQLQGELRELRAADAVQAAATTSLKEELATRRADVGHLKQLTGELRSANEHLRQQLTAAQEAAAAAQGTLSHVRSEKLHYEGEVGRLGEECSRLSAELDRNAREVVRLKEWQDVLKKVEAGKLREEQEAHARTRAEAEKKEALWRADVRAREDRLTSRDAELDTQRKANGLLQLQVKDLQKQLSLCQGERTAAATARDEHHATVGKLQAEIQRIRLDAAQCDKERAVAESAAKEAAAADKARLQAKLKEAGREATLTRALSEGWQRELREARSRISALTNELEAVRSQLSEGKVEHVRSGAAAEGQVVALRVQLAAREEEVRRVKLDASSAQKQLEKAVERLQREVDASAAEVARLKGGEDAALFTRLPPVGRPATIHDELEALRKALRDRMAGPMQGPTAGGGGAGPLPMSAPVLDSHSPLTSPTGGGGGGGSSLPALVVGSFGTAVGNGLGGGGGSSASAAALVMTSGAGGGGGNGVSERQPHLRNRTR
ncbi:hypothetical protein VaNZ11_010650 [Volvox africanus]|uniref:Uncharacterized protein n=1 Tax=Volvox africanus TaxID=51714 RepID=A0ABQ5SB49_9CHLO|nr:hypothetical protein VaNZ11_010650 [Volvox africanus]